MKSPTLGVIKPFQVDPPVRKNGRCVICGAKRPALAIACGDPFCRTECAKRFHVDGEEAKT